ncbi:MAG: hypothetical protein ACRD2N_23640 [Vicinamibacterales bacterium]
MSPRPKTDRPRVAPPKGRLLRKLFSAVSVSAVVMAPVAALALWLLLTDPVTAAGVIERGDLFPVVKALATLVGKALTAVMRFL